MAAGVIVIAVDELTVADQRLREQARRIEEAADDLVVSTGDLPPEAQSIVAGLPGLRTRLDAAARQIRSAADTFGSVAAEARNIDAGGWLAQAWNGLRGVVVPSDGSTPLGLAQWILGRVALGTGAAVTALKYAHGFPWVKDGPQWRSLTAGPKLNPRWRGKVAKAGKVASVAGTALTFGGALEDRLHQGKPVSQAVTGAGGETASIWACATAGARIASGLPIPHPYARAAVVVGAGIVSGAGCSGPGKWVGDRAGDATDAIGRGIANGARGEARGASKVGNFVANVASDGAHGVARGATKVGDFAGDVASDGAHGIAKGASKVSNAVESVLP